LSATAAPPSGASAPTPAVAVPGPGRPSGGALVWVAVAVATLAAWVVLTWPLALHPDHFWTMAGNRASAGQPNFVSRPGSLAGGDHLQNVFIQSVVVDNARELRSLYLDLREGAAGPAPLRTTSLDVPWTVLLALVWPLAGLVPAYNLSLALSSVATGLAAFGWLRRHTRWPLLAAAGAWRLGWTYQTLGRPKDAIEIVMTAAAALEPGLGAASPPHLSMWGSLHLNAAIAAAQAGERAAARDLLGEARATARRLGVDRNDFQTFFGPTNVAIYEVSIPVELGDGGIAVERAGIDTSGVKSLERRAHHLIDVARGYGQWAKDSEAVHTLLEAEQLAPEEVHYNVMVREFVRDLLRRERRSIKRDLRGLAQRVGVLA